MTAVSGVKTYDQIPRSPAVKTYDTAAAATINEGGTVMSASSGSEYGSLTLARQSQVDRDTDAEDAAAAAVRRPTETYM